VVRRKVTDIGAHFFSLFGGKCEQRADFVQGEPEFARTSDEG